MNAEPPLIAHVIHHLAMGGMENGLINLINRMPEHRYRHAIVCAEDATDFRHRITRANVEIVELHKSQRSVAQLWKALYQTFRRLRPSIVHSRNMSGLDALFPAFLAGVPVRIHGEHGRDVSDPDGKNRKFRWIRRVHRPLVTHYIALSEELATYLNEAIGVPNTRITQICNGVDMQRFFGDREKKPTGILPPDWYRPGLCIVGTVGRAQAVKDHACLIRALAHLIAQEPDLRQFVRLAIVGDGPLLEASAQLAYDLGIASLTWLPGARDDVPQVLRCFDLFVLPSLAEGISNSILEAMATGLPIVASRVGGNAQLIEEGQCGHLVEPADMPALANALQSYILHSEKMYRHGKAARARVEKHFSLDGMVNKYADLYDALIKA